MQTFIPSEEKLKELISDTVQAVLEKKLPSLIEESKRKKWLNKEEVKELLDISDRQLQYMRDERQIPFSQRGRMIWYPTQGIEQFLLRHRVKADWEGEEIGENIILN